MAVIPIRGIGLMGLQKDALEQDIPANGLTTASNVRIRDRAITTLSDVSNSITFLETEDPLFADKIWRAKDVVSGLLVVLSDSEAGAFKVDDFSEAFLIDGEVRVFFYPTSGTRIEIGPSSPLQTVTTWHGNKNAETYILNNGKADLPHTWDTTNAASGAMAPMVGWPVEYKCSFMDSFKNFIVAGDISISGSDVFGLVKWSHPRAPGDAAIFWDHTDPTLLAGENNLALDSRAMTGIQQLKDLMIIYFDRLVVRMQFVGGQFVMDFQTVFTDDGAYSSRSMVEVNGMAYVFGFYDVYAHDGYQKRTLSDLRMTNYQQQNIDPKSDIDVTYYAINDELIFLVRSPAAQSDIDGDRLFIYNIGHDAWTEADVTINSTPAIGLIFTGPNIIEGELASSWSTITGNWDTQGALNWGGTFLSADRETLYALSLSQHVIYDFDSKSSAGVSTFRDKAIVQHTHIDLDDTGETVGDRLVYVNRVYPQLRGTGSVRFRFGVHNTAQSPVDWITQIEFKIAKDNESDPAESAADYACDLRMAGRYLAYEITTIGDARFAFTGMDIEVDRASEV